MASDKYKSKNSVKQDLIAARNELKAFRHDVAILKKKGLLSSKYDARRVTPSKYLKSKIREFENVLKGLATAAKADDKTREYYKKKGAKIVGKRVIIPHSKNEKIISSHGKISKVTRTEFGKISAIDKQFYALSIEQWEKEIRKIRLKKNESLGFSFFGNPMTFNPGNIDGVLLRLTNYETVVKTFESEDKDRILELIDNVILYRVDRTGPEGRSLIPAESIDPAILEERRRKRAYRRERWLSRMSEQEFESHMDKKAAYEKERRQKIAHKNPQQHEREKEKARARAKKSYDNRKNKK